MSSITPNYNVSTSEMIQDSGTMRENFLDYKSDFIAFSGQFNDPHSDDWNTARTASINAGTDEIYIDQQETKTEEVLTQMAAGRKKYKEVKFFALAAFKGKKGILNEFGLDDYKTARNDQDVMIIFLFNLSKAAVKYSTELIAKNYSQPKIDEIITIANALDTADKAQEKHKSQRPVKSDERYVIHNTTYAFDQMVSAASKVIWDGNPTMINLFALNASDEDQDETSIRGNVKDIQGNNIENLLVRIDSLNLETTTDSNGNYAFLQLPDATYDVQFSKLGFVTQNKSVVVVDGVMVVQDVVMVAV